MELKRALHTLKGGARMAGAMAMGNLAHNTESLLGQIESGRRRRQASDVIDLLDEAHDTLVTMLDSLRAGHKSMIGAQGIECPVLAATGQATVARQMPPCQHLRHPTPSSS